MWLKSNIETIKEVEGKKEEIVEIGDQDHMIDQAHMIYQVHMIDQRVEKDLIVGIKIVEPEVETKTEER